MGENLHEKHRERVLAEILENGITDRMPEHKILEFLLFYCVPRKDTNPLAHEMLNAYGNLAGVLDAPIEDLCKFSGITPRGAALLKSIIPISGIYQADKKVFSPDFGSFEDIGNFLTEKFSGFTDERAGLLLLNSAGKLIDFKLIPGGDVGSVGLPIREVLKFCLQKNAGILVIAHNHPGGIALPSASDIAYTEKLVSALSGTGIRLIDHIIVSNFDYVSLSQSKEYSHLFER